MLLPLIGGYIFLTQFIYFRFKYQKLRPQRVLFASIFTGIILVFIAYLFRIILDLINPEIIKTLYNWLYLLPIKKVDYLWTAVFTFWFPIIGTSILNLVIGIERVGRWIKPPAQWWVEKYGNELEQLFMSSVIQGKALQVTLKSRKTYIGFAPEIPEPGQTNYLKLTPILSGYRRENTLQMKIVTNYFVALQKINNTNFGAPMFDYDITIKQDEILTATFYNVQLQNSLVQLAKKKKKKEGD